jgi:hydrogenase nickel incorporation protein HypB
MAETVRGDAERGERCVLTIQQGLLDKNDRLAARNREAFHAKGLFVLNVVSSPGSGKTALLERTLSELKGRVRAGVIVGDLATDNDAERLQRAGVDVVQITTGTVCHLEAAMVARAAAALDLDALELLVVENVGNLVCPAGYDLGEDVRVVLLSVTEGEDKPLKYPTIFKSAHVVVVSKTDLAAATAFDREAALGNVRRMAPQARVFELSARTGQGMAEWLAYLEKAVRERQGRVPACS